MRNIVNELSKGLTSQLTEADSELQTLHIATDYNYQQSLSIEATGSLKSGEYVYDCEIVIKLNKVEG